MEFKVGDKIKITKSPYNWSKYMDAFDGKIVIINEIDGGGRVRFKNDGNWTWKFSDGHFIPISQSNNYELWM